MALDIQFAGPDGKWIKLLGHDCTSVAEMNSYVGLLGSSVRVADDCKIGEPTGSTPKPKPPVCAMTWGEFDTEEARLKAVIDTARQAKDAAFRDNTTAWIDRVREFDSACYRLRDLRERMGPRPSPDLEPMKLYRLIQGKRGWGYWYDLAGVQVRSTLISYLRDAPAVEVQLQGLTGEHRVVSCRHEINNARGWDRCWWLVEPTQQEKVALRRHFAL